jgi:hypothetical protein
MSPDTNSNIKNPQTKVQLNKAANNKEMANKLAAVCRSVFMSDVVELIGLDPQRMTLTIVFNNKRLSALKLNTSSTIIFGQIKKALDSLKLSGYEFAGKTLDLGRPFTVRILSSDRTELMLAKESVLSAKISGITNANLVKVTEEGGQYGLDIRDATNETLAAVVGRLGEYLDLQTIDTNNLSWIYRNFGLEAYQHHFIKELDFQMNGKGGIGEYDVRYIRMIADVIGEEGIPLSLGPKAASGLGSGGNYSVLSAASTEGAPNAIMGGAIMGNLDHLEGPAEAIVAGATPSIGDYVPTS